MNNSVSVLVRLSSPLSERIGSRGKIEVNASTVRESLEAIALQYPVFAQLIWSENDQINPALLVFLNDEKIDSSQLDQATLPNTQLDIIPAISGG